jgi:hypothetical protein
MNKANKAAGPATAEKKIAAALSALEAELEPAKLPKAVRQDLGSSIARLRQAVGKI